MTKFIIAKSVTAGGYYFTLELFFNLCAGILLLEKLRNHRLFVWIKEQMKN